MDKRRHKTTCVKCNRRFQPGDKIGFSFCSKSFERGEGWCNLKNADKVTYDDVWSVLERIFQSSTTGFNTDTFCLKTTTVRLPKGKGPSRNQIQYF